MCVITSLTQAIQQHMQTVSKKGLLIKKKIVLFTVVCAGSSLAVWAFSSCGEWGLFSSSDMWASLSYDIWNLPKPGIEPIFPAMTGRFLTTGPSGNFYLGFIFF